MCNQFRHDLTLLQLSAAPLMGFLFHVYENHIHVLQLKLTVLLCSFVIRFQDLFTQPLNKIPHQKFILKYLVKFKLNNIIIVY